MLTATRELLSAAQDMIQADCRRHRERATRRLSAALEGMKRDTGHGEREHLLRDLVAYAEEFSEDPTAAALVERARAQGLLS